MSYDPGQLPVSSTFFPEDLYNAKRRTHQIIKECFKGLLVLSVHSNDLVATRFLLEIGVPPDYDDGISFVEKALGMCWFDMATLLRRHHAPFNRWAREMASKIGNEWVRANLHTVQFANTFLEHLETPPNPAPVATHMYALSERMGYPVHVHTSWPPVGVAQWPPANIPKSTRGYVIDLWHELGKLRRAEARLRRKQNWDALRRGHRLRCIAMYWFGQMQERSCAADGRGRAEDRAAALADGVVE